MKTSLAGKGHAHEMYKHLAGAALLATLAACAGPTHPPQPIATTLPPRFRPTGAEAPLLPFFQALDSLATPGAPPVTVLQIGDSHTANDSFSSALRDRLQARFGNAGRGLLQPGTPFRWYRPEAVSVQTTGFTAISSFSATTEGPFGIAAVRQHAENPAQASLSTTDGSTIATAEFEFWAQQGGGAVQIAAPPAPPRIVATSGAPNVATNGAPHPFWVQLQAPPGTSAITLNATGNGPVDWLAWSVSRGTTGIQYANLGTPGATIELLDRWDPSLVQAEFAHIKPALLIIAFGTNEGFREKLDPQAYEQDFQARLAALHEAAPGASLIVFGAPDGERARKRGRPEATPCNAAWAIPPHLAEIRALEREAAARQFAYYWDWSAAMGGACGMAHWASANPPLGMPDHVHMRTPGYAITADALFTTLMRAYDHYRGVPGGV